MIPALLAGIRGTWRKLRAWRRISFTSGGLVFTIGALAVGFAAMNTGNNLLYLLLGSMLGFIAVSGWLSEQAIWNLGIERHLFDEQLRAARYIPAGDRDALDGVPVRHVSEAAGHPHRRRGGGVAAFGPAGAHTVTRRWARTEGRPFGPGRRRHHRRVP